MQKDQTINQKTNSNKKPQASPLKRIVMGISGASGMIYAVRFLLKLPEGYQVHLVPTENALKIMKSEMGWDLEKETFSQYVERSLGQTAPPVKIIPHHWQNQFASVGSGSFKTEGMVVVPCSSKTLAGIASGYVNNLVERAAEVNMKERRPTVLIVRETPYTTIHLENMKRAALAGATILAASPAFHHQPQSIEDLADYVVAKTFDQLGIAHTFWQHWRE